MSDFNNLYIPAALGPYAMLAPYWDDLKGMKTGVDGQGNGIFANMRVCYWHDAANNRYIVEWNDAYNNFTIDLMEDASLEKFQIILYPRTTQDGDIVYQYHTVDNPATTNNYCTVGIENHLQNDGLTYTFSNFYPVTASPLTGNLAVKFTTDAPDSFESNEDNVAADLLISNLQNSPNPFNPETTISFQLSKQAEVSVEIYNTKGQLVRTLLSGNLSKGKQTVAWNGKDNSGLSVGSGIYLYKVKSGTYTSTRKMMLMK
jgi:hypothetical protein